MSCRDEGREERRLGGGGIEIWRGRSDDLVELWRWRVSRGGVDDLVELWRWRGSRGGVDDLGELCSGREQGGRGA